jgi:hypothetical protein
LRSVSFLFLSSDVLDLPPPTRPPPRPSPVPDLPAIDATKRRVLSLKKALSQEPFS